MKNSWNFARKQWNSSNGVSYYYMSNSGYKQGLMKKASSSLYGEIVYPKAFSFESILTRLI